MVGEFRASIPGQRFAERCRELANRLDQGIHLAIDDFGTGYSSLQQLYKLPFAELKIDRSFVVGLPGDGEARSIVRGTVDLTHALGMIACAEGVETQAALDYLETIGCDKAQGYLISRPVPASDIAAFVSRWNAHVSAPSSPQQTP